MDTSIEQEGKIINSDAWNSMSLQELYDQKNIMYDRMNIASSLSNLAILTSLQNSMYSLEYHISEKFKSESLNTKRVVI